MAERDRRHGRWVGEHDRSLSPAVLIFVPIIIDSRLESKIFPSISNDGEVVLVSENCTHESILEILTIILANLSTQIPLGSSPPRLRMRSGLKMNKPQALVVKQVPVEQLWVLARRYSAGM